MLERLKSKDQQLINAIEQSNLTRLASLLNRLNSNAINSPIKNGPCAVERAILANQAKALRIILSKGGNANGTTADSMPFIFLAIKQNESLALLSCLLEAGANISTLFEQQSLLQYCSKYCIGNQLMLHLSRLNQHGTSLSQASWLLEHALEKQDQPLIQFLISCGASLDDSINCELYDNELLNYAKKLQQDRDLRQQFLQL